MRNVYSDIANGRTLRLTDIPDVDHDPSDQSIYGVLPDPSGCTSQENFNLYIMQCLRILAGYHANTHVLDGTESAEGDEWDQDDVDAGGAMQDGNNPPTNIDGGMSRS